jgi:hypothetical protein
MSDDIDPEQALAALLDDEDEEGMKELKPKGRPKMYYKPKLMTNRVDETFLNRVNARALKEGKSRAILIQTIVGRYILDAEELDVLKTEKGKIGDLEVCDGVVCRPDGMGSLVLKAHGRTYSLDNAAIRKLYLLSKR